MTVLTSASLGTTDDREHPEDFLETDQWGRHKVRPPSGRGLTGYRRASGWGGPLESDYNLWLWKMRQAARGISRTDHIAIAITRAEARLVQAEQVDDWDAAKAAKEELNELCQAAMKAVGSDAAAEIGTAAHNIYECVDLGLDPGHVPTSLKADLIAYCKLVGPRFKMVSVERFIVHDELKVAGTLDRAVQLRIPMVPLDDRGHPAGEEIPAGSVLIGDVKTSQDMSFAGCKFALQVLAYAEGTPYNTKTHEREEWGHAAPRTDWAVIIHVPSRKGTAALHWVNLNDARVAAQDALKVYAWRNRLGKKLISKAEAAEIVEDFLSTARGAESDVDLMAAYYRAVAVGQWNDELRAVFAAQKLALLERAS